MNAALAWLLWSQRDLLVRALIVILGLLLAFMILIFVPLMVVTGQLGSGGNPSVPEGADIPAVFIPVYREAERVYKVNWLILAALHKTESSYGENQGPSSAGAIGHMQFLPSTWTGYKDAYKRGERPGGVPEVKPHPNTADVFDATMAAALYIKGLGGGMDLDEKMLAALTRYKGTPPASIPYAKETLAIAKAWQKRQPAGGELELIPGSVGGRLSKPVSGAIVSGFGMRWGRLHAGVDIAATTNTPIAAAESGRITLKGTVGGYGKYACIYHASVRVTTCYAHMIAYGSITVGQRVRRRSLIGYVGCSGHCYGPHLHFEVRRGSSPRSQPVDPMSWF